MKNSGWHNFISSIRRPVLCALFAAGISAAGNGAADSAASTGVYGAFSLAAGDYSARFSPRYSYALEQIVFQGQRIGLNNGNYGFIFHGGDMKFVGGNNKDSAGNATEKIISMQLIVDGVEIPAPAPAEINVLKTGEFITKSKIRGISVMQRTIITPTGIQRYLNLNVDEDTSVWTGYAFMVCWAPTTTEWMAQDESGELIEGIFDTQGLILRKESVAWVAVYEPEMNVAMLASYSPENLPGKDIGHALQDLATHQYHKLYYQPFSRETLHAGEKYSFAMKIQGVRVKPERWKEDVIKTAQMTKEH
ncbi:MAG: hypothetical protein WC959_11130 [Kiritimatiellales bacterium]